MTVREKTNFELGGVKYYISKVLHLTTGAISEVHFEQVHYPHEHFIRTGEQFLAKTRSIFTGETITTTELQQWYKKQYKSNEQHPHK